MKMLPLLLLSACFPPLPGDAGAHPPEECECPPPPLLVCEDGSEPVPGFPVEGPYFPTAATPYLEDFGEEESFEEMPAMAPPPPPPAPVPKAQQQQQQQRKQEAVKRALDAIEAVEEYESKH